jgi:hypothetical protein
MATQQQQIQQAQATLQMLEQLHRAKRVSEQELQQAKRRLADLQAERPYVPLVPLVPRHERVGPPPPPAPEPEPTGRRVDQDEYLSLQADLSADADHLNRQMAELSNQLHKVPMTAGCAELTRPILALKGQIETIWDKKRYLERNRCLPEEPTQETDPDGQTSGSVSALKYELAYKKRRLIDLRYKLKEKLKNLAAKPGKVQQWREELVQTNMEIAEIDIQLGTL